MQLKNKYLILIAVLVILLIGALLVIKSVKTNDIKTEYYYNYVYDDNKVTQSVKIYNKKNKLQSNYYIFYNDEPISYTKGEKAVVTINAVDLKTKPSLYISFEDDINKKYEVSYKK